jgi:tetratricopeptide (TPR) repeat protein
MHDKAIAEIEEAIKLNEGNPKTQIFLGTVYAKAGQTDKAHQILRGLETGKNYVSPAELAMLYAVLGDHQAALASIEKAFAEHDLQLQYVDLPAYDSLQSEPRFQDVVRRIGLTRENGPGPKTAPSR